VPLSPILQSEASECGLACLAMVANAHQVRLSLAELRRRFPVSLKGATLQQLISHAAEIGLSARPLKLELGELRHLSLPCILHWDLNHFVVLARMKGRRAVILDPAQGQRSLALEVVSRHFTGVALELWREGPIRAEVKAPRMTLAAITGRIHGLRSSIAQVLVVALVLEVFAVVAPLLNQLVVDQVLASSDHDLLFLLIGGFGLLLTLQALIGAARSWMVIVMSQTMSLQWHSNVFTHLVRLPVSFFEKRHLGDVSSRFDAVGEIQRTLTTSTIEALLDGVMAAAALLMMALYSPRLTLIVCAAVAGYTALRVLAYGPMREATAERISLAARERSHFLETLRSITPLKLFVRSHQRRAHWQNLLVEVQNRDVRTAKLSILYSTANSLIFGFENLAVLWTGANAIMSPEAGARPLTIGMLFAFLAYKMQFTGRVSALINHGMDFRMHFRMLGLQVERLSEIALEPPESAERAPAVPLDHLPASLTLKDVSFRYGASEPWILRHVNLTVGAGENVAITGSSGSGKTTLLKVALGLLMPDEGEVLYGGIPIRRLGLDNFRRQIGTVMQEDGLLSGSIADNIAFFEPEADERRMQACARVAQVHDDILKMPMAYHSLVGDLGSGLSGGQKQRILLARALYKRPRVLALDEATSHLDLPNEVALVAALAKMRLTRLTIAHRPDTIASADRVVHLHDGQLRDGQLRETRAPENLLR
jgi:ATP-binding cassette, subfamily B, bacterial CvaB/MchF/RaxB